MYNISFSRNLAVIALVVILGLVAGGCVAPAPETTGEGAATGEDQIVLRVGTGDSGEGLNPHQEIIRRFEEANPRYHGSVRTCIGQRLLWPAAYARSRPTTHPTS